MNIDVTFTESTTEIPAQFSGLQIVTNGVPPDEVDKLVADAKAKGVEIGKKAQNDTFWDSFQVFGRRTNYANAFNHEWWTDANFCPKYDLNIVQGSLAFQYTAITDLKDKLENLGLKLNTSECAGWGQMFQGAKIRHIPALDARKATLLQYTFATHSAIETIDKLIVSESTPFENSTFMQAYQLRSILFEGMIGPSINFSWSAFLTNASVQSIIDHLKDRTGNISQTVTLHADVGAKMTEAQKAAVTAKNWTLVY